MMPKEDSDRGSVAVVTDLDDEDLEDRAEQLFGEKYKVAHSQPLCKRT